MGLGLSEQEMTCWGPVTKDCVQTYVVDHGKRLVLRSFGRLPAGAWPAQLSQRRFTFPFSKVPQVEGFRFMLDFSLLKALSLTQQHTHSLTK